MINILLFFTCCAWVSVCAVLARRWGRQALTTFIVVQALLANWMVLKQITIFGLNATPSDPFVIGGTLALIFLQEQSGQKAAREALFLAWAALLFFCVIAIVQIAYIPSLTDTADLAYQMIFYVTPRLLIASAGTYFISERLNLYLYHYMRTKFPTRESSARWLAIVISQAFDTVCFSICGLYGVVQDLTDIMVMSYIIKLICCFCIVPLAQGLLKKLPERTPIS